MSMIERMLQEDIRMKKRSGNGIYHKTGIRGMIGKVMFASDLMTTRQKRSYEKGGEVVSWNTKKVLSKEEFNTYDTEQQKEMLTAWRANFTNKQIIKEMGLTPGIFYNLLSKLDVKKGQIHRNRHSNKPNSTAISEPRSVIELVEKKPTMESTTAPVFTPGLNFNINGQYNAETLSTWLTKLQMMVEGTGDYDVVIHLREKK